MGWEREREDKGQHLRGCGKEISRKRSNIYRRFAMLLLQVFDVHHAVLSSEECYKLDTIFILILHLSEVSHVSKVKHLVNGRAGFEPGV